MMPLPEQQRRRYWAAALQLEKEQNMEELTPPEQDFLDAGIQRGAAAILARLLTRRFGPRPQTVQKKLASAGLER